MKKILSIIFGFLLFGTVVILIWAYAPDKERGELQSKYLASPNDIIKILDADIHVRDSGLSQSGETIIMIHGLGSHLQTWDGWSKALEKQHRVIRFDLPGAGLSSLDANGDYSDERSLLLILALMEHLKVEKAHFIGNSLGGRLAWKFASQHIDRVNKLVLVSPDGFASPGFEYGKPAEVPFVMNLMQYLLPKSMLRSNLEIAYDDPKNLTDPVMDRYYDLMLAQGNRKALLDRMRQTVLVTPEPYLKRITVPVLLLWGENDRMIPASNAQDYLTALPNAQLVKLENLGHVPFEESPDRSLIPVINFLNE